MMRRLAVDPTMRQVVGVEPTEHAAASTSQMGRFESEDVDPAEQPEGVDESIRKMD